MLKTLFILIILYLKCCIFAQTISNQKLSTSGDSYSNHSFSVSWTLGELLDGTFQSDDAIIISGLQDIKIRKTTAITDDGINTSVIVYPNPTKDRITINHSISKTKNLYIKLFDYRGNIVFVKKISNSNQNIPMTKIADGPYILQVIDNNRVHKSVKIIKTRKGE